MNNFGSTMTQPILARWYEALAHYQQTGAAHVLATVIAVNGSAPRELQAKMIITLDACCDTLGGGGLEHDVVITARQLLKGEIDSNQPKKSISRSKKLGNVDSDDTKTNIDSHTDFENPKAVRRDNVYTKHYPLGAKLAQCCGGSVTVMFECFNVTPPLSILVFGAGHVAAALMRVLAELPCQVDWVDSRAERFEPYLLGNSDSANSSQQSSSFNNKTNHTDLDNEDSTANPSPRYQLPAHIRAHIDEEPVDFILPFIEPAFKPLFKQGGQRFILIMTHDHSLDFELARAALDTIADAENAMDSNTKTNNESAKISKTPYVGCIGSATKAKRFKDRLLQRGYSQQLVDKLTMPIGLPIGGKEPMAVAVSIAAQILQYYYQP